ncbi:prepilin-type N-terminal cleavage/methylation domain-containing protein [Methylophilaceae bacterium 11]|nr:prepilin-type N-terminal cleavage/methylation domain-containing protein [Methylophilaceae bacterium 11]
MRRPSKPYFAAVAKGFTIVEMIVVITVVGILAAGAATFIRNPTQAYFDVENYANLTDRADTALRRMSREMRNALPNSVRATTNGADSFIEFIPVTAAGRYRAEVGTSASDNPLDFSLSADSFDVLGTPLLIAGGQQLVIYNLGVTGVDAYEGSNRRTLTTAGTLSTLSFSGNAFPQPSPSSRFYVVATATTFACDMTNRRLMMYSGYAIQSAQPASIGALNALTTGRQIAANVASCQMRYIPGALQRSGIVVIYLGLSQDTARVNLMHQVNVVNSP